MLPSIPIGKILISPYPFVAILSMVLSGFLFSSFAKLYGLKRKQIIVLLITVFPAILVGSKAFNALIDHRDENFPIFRFMIMPGGFSLYGGIIAGAFVFAITAKFMKIGAGKALDLFSIPASFGFSLGRLLHR